jgi:hypothetical protein
MTNPVTKWELQEFSLEFDIGKLMENFFNLRSFSTFGVIHTHHIQAFSFQTDAINALTGANHGPFNWPEGFPVGVTPLVFITTNSGAGVSGWLTHTAFNISNTQVSVQTNNLHHTTNLAAGQKVAVMGIDTTYNTADY